MDRGSLTDLVHKWHAVDYGEELMSAVLFQVKRRARAWALAPSVDDHLVRICEQSLVTFRVVIAMATSVRWENRLKLPPVVNWW